MVTEKAYKSLTDVRSLMVEQARLPVPSLAAILTAKEFAVVNEQLAIIEKYRNTPISEVDLTIINEDLVKLSALNIYAGMNSGYMGGNVYHSDDEIRISQAKAAAEAKKIAEDLVAAGEQVRVTDKDTTSLARIKAQNTVFDVARCKAASEALKTVYYAIHEFINVLKLSLRIQLKGGEYE